MPKIAKQKKVKRTKATRKPQPLSKSVQSLLKYLGGSDVKVGGARGGQPAQLAPTNINIAVSQQQQQQQAQAQQFIRQRVAPKGEVIGRSPLSAVAAQAPIIINNQPQRLADYEKKKEEDQQKAEANQNEINRKFGLLEASQQQFRDAAVGAYQEVKADINRRVGGDANIFDGRNLAAQFGTGKRPVVEEPTYQGVSASRPVGIFGGIEVSEMFGGSISEQQSSGLGEYLGSKYVQDVTNPQMTAIKRPGRPRKSEEEKAATKRSAAEKKKASKISPAESASSSKLLESREPATIAGFTAVPTQGYLVKDKPVTRTIIVKKKPQQGTPDMATQIQLLTGGGGAAASLSSGRTIAELMGSKK